MAVASAVEIVEAGVPLRCLLSLLVKSIWLYYLLGSLWFGLHRWLHTQSHTCHLDSHSAHTHTL